MHKAIMTSKAAVIDAVDWQMDGLGLAYLVERRDRRRGRRTAQRTESREPHRRNQFVTVVVLPSCEVEKKSRSRKEELFQ